MMQNKEYWVNVYEYKTVKNTQFYSHGLDSKEDAQFRSFMRSEARKDCKTVYRIYVKMKEVKGFKRDYGLVWYLDGLYEGEGRAPVAVRPQLSFPRKYERNNFDWFN